MSYVDRVMYKALKVYGYYHQQGIDKIKREDLEKFRKKVDKRTEEYLLKNKMIKRVSNPLHPMITEKGLNELRVFEERRLKHITIGLSIIAIIISILSLIKSFGFI